MEDKRKEFSTENDGIITNELIESSSLNLDYLSSLINSHDYFQNDQKDIEINHINFLKNEYLDIINNYYNGKDILHAFNYNINILENQINADKERIKQIFSEYKMKLDKKDRHIERNLEDQILGGTNYVIREREKEKVRELKVIVQDGNLESEIPQDF